MTLHEYIKKNGGVTKFANQIGVTRGAVHHWLKGFRVPKPSIAKRIEAETRGKVTLSTLYTKAI